MSVVADLKYQVCLIQFSYLLYALPACTAHPSEDDQEASRVLHTPDSCPIFKDRNPGSSPEFSGKKTRRQSRHNNDDTRVWIFALPGGASRDRTDDIQLAKLALSQLSYGPFSDLQPGEWWV